MREISSQKADHISTNKDTLCIPGGLSIARGYSNRHLQKLVKEPHRLDGIIIMLGALVKALCYSAHERQDICFTLRIVSDLVLCLTE